MPIIKMWQRIIIIEDYIYHIFQRKKEKTIMKKIILSMCVILTVISSLSVYVFASTQKKTFEVDFSNSYVTSVSNGAITMRYNPANFFLYVRASTDLSVSNDATGYSYVKITALNGDYEVSSSTKKDGNVINSGKATVNNQAYAKRINHYASRVINKYSESWDYYCE